MALGNNVKIKRVELQLTQKQLGDMIGVSQVAIANLEKRDSASSRNISALSKALGVSPFELESGLLSNVQEQSGVYGMIPVISWVNAGECGEVVDFNAPGMAEEFVPRINGGDRVYGLHVRGNSMTAPEGISPTFPEGYIIHVDPDQATSPNDYVIAKLVGEDMVTFKQLKEGDKPYLSALNPDHKPIYNEFRILGKVIGVSLKL